MPRLKAVIAPSSRRTAARARRSTEAGAGGRK